MHSSLVQRRHGSRWQSFKLCALGLQLVVVGLPLPPPTPIPHRLRVHLGAEVQLLLGHAQQLLPRARRAVVVKPGLVKAEEVGVLRRRIGRGVGVGRGVGWGAILLCACVC